MARFVSWNLSNWSGTACLVRKLLSKRTLPDGFRPDKDDLLQVPRGNRIWIVDSWAPECLLNRQVRSYAEGLKQLNRALAEAYKARIVFSRIIRGPGDTRFSITQLQKR